MNNVHLPPWITGVVLPALALVASIVVARVTAKGNQRVSELDRELPPYDALAARTSDLEALTKELEKEIRAERKAADERTKCLETAVDDLRNVLATVRDELDEDREWIKDTVVVAEQRGATEYITPIPAWIDLDSESMRQRRRRMYGWEDDDQPDGVAT